MSPGPMDTSPAEYTRVTEAIAQNAVEHPEWEYKQHWDALTRSGQYDYQVCYMHIDAIRAAVAKAHGD